MGGLMNDARSTRRQSWLRKTVLGVTVTLLAASCGASSGEERELLISRFDTTRQIGTIKLEHSGIVIGSNDKWLRSFERHT
mgnify:CR=1 FL=1